MIKLLLKKAYELKFVCFSNLPVATALKDLGVFAVLIFIYAGYRSYQLFSMEKKNIQQSAFFYLMVKLIREGHYFPPEFYFFLFIFLKDFDEDITHS